MDGAQWNFVLVWVLITLMVCAVCALYVWFCLHRMHVIRERIRRGQLQPHPAQSNSQAPVHFSPQEPDYSTPTPSTRSSLQHTRVTPQSTPCMNRPLPPRPNSISFVSPYAISYPSYSYVNFPPPRSTRSDVIKLKSKHPKSLPVMGTRSLDSETPEYYI